MDTNTRFDGKKVYYVVTPAIAFRRADAMPVVAMRQNGADLCILRYGVFSYGDMVIWSARWQRWMKASCRC